MHRNGIINHINQTYDVNPEMVAVLNTQQGFAPAYHMNKKHWLTILLDGSVSKEQIIQLLDISYELTKKR